MAFDWKASERHGLMFSFQAFRLWFSRFDDPSDSMLVFHCLCLLGAFSAMWQCFRIKRFGTSKTTPRFTIRIHVKRLCLVVRVSLCVVGASIQCRDTLMLAKPRFVHEHALAVYACKPVAWYEIATRLYTKSQWKAVASHRRSIRLDRRRR